MVDGKSVFKRIDWAIYDRDQTKLDKWTRAFNNARPDDANYSVGASEIKVPDADIKAAAIRMGYLAPLPKALIIDDDDDKDEGKTKPGAQRRQEKGQAKAKKVNIQGQGEAKKERERKEQEEEEEEESNLLGPIVNNKNYDTDTKILLLQEQDVQLRDEQNETLNSRGKLGSKTRLHSIQDKRREIQEVLSVLRQSQFAGEGESYSGRARAEKRLAALNVKIDEKTSQGLLDKTLLAINDLQKTSTDPILAQKYKDVTAEQRRRFNANKATTKTKPSTSTSGTNAAESTALASPSIKTLGTFTKTGFAAAKSGGQGQGLETLEPYDLVIRRKRLANLYWRACFEAYGYDKAGNPLGARLLVISDMLNDSCVIVGEPDSSTIISADEKAFRGPSAGYKAVQRFTPDQAHAPYAMGLSDIFNQVAQQGRTAQGHAFRSTPDAPVNFLQQLISGDTTKYPQFAQKIVLVPMWVGGSHYQHILIDGRTGKKRAYFWDPMNRLSPYEEDANKTYGYYTYVSWWKQHMIPLNWTMEVIDWQLQIDDKYNCAIYGLYFLAHYVELDTYTIHVDPKKPFERKERFLFDLGEGKTDVLIKQYATPQVNKQRDLFAKLTLGRRLEEKKRIQDAVVQQQQQQQFTDTEFNEITRMADELANERGVAPAKDGGEDAIVERDAIFREVALARLRVKQDAKNSQGEAKNRLEESSNQTNLPLLFQRVPGLLVANNNTPEASNYYDTFNQYARSQLGIVRTHGSTRGNDAADKNFNLIVALRMATE